MNILTLREAIKEAERFIKVAKKVKTTKLTYEYINDGKETSACRRASMDLTRLLADLRQNR